MPNLCTVSSNASSNFIFGVQPHNFYNVFGSRRTRPRCRVSMSSSDPQNAVVVGCGSVTMDFLATVAAYPKPDDKIRSTSLKVQGGGNVGNALTCLARLGLNPRLISKIADDSQGRSILDELRDDGVDTSFIVVSKEGTSPFTYIIVDNQTKTRTCIHTAGYPPMIPDELSKSSLLSALDGAKFAYFDGRLPDTALVVAQEAVRKNIPILIDAERPREGLDDLLKLADYVVCSAKFPASWTKASTVPQALVSMLLRLPNIKFVIVTLGKDGCIMLERSVDGPSTEEVDVDSLLESLEIKRDKSVSIPTCISSVMSAKPKILFLLSVAKLKAEGIGTVSGKLYVGTAESIPPSELVDTTGAGDAFIGAVIYAICAKFTPETMLSFAANVAGAKCRDLGARSGLPYRADPRIASFVLEKLSSSA
ncbi:Ketohexokinase [Glycine max]|nr:Ketohexokinase [Glycine max]